MESKDERMVRLRTHLQDARRLSFVGHIHGELQSGMQLVTSRGCDLAIVNLTADLLDRDLETAMWRQRIVGATAPAPLRPQLDRARYLGLPAILHELPDKFDVDALSELAAFVASAEGHLWLQTSWSEEGWHRFDAARRLFDHHPQVHVALDVRSAPPTPAQIERWCGEPVVLLVAGDDAPDELAPLFRSVTERIVLDDPTAPVRGALEALHQSVWQGVPDRERHAAGFSGAAIAPIEPLGDNLPSAVYEVIESDPVKYRRYQDAVRLAAADRPDPLHVAVVGAGRGGLVQEVLKAANLLKRKFEVTALEKNPGALESLHARNRREWNDAVDVVAADMRTWTPTRPIHIIVSELLGGFGDNELSPECLLRVESLLADGGAIIPSRYTSYVAPVTAASIYMAVKDRQRMHTVALDRAVLVAPPAPCFGFVHPGHTAERGAQKTSMTFEPRLDAVVHGFAGFFDTTLYGDVELSIVPATATPQMRSWQPVFFPLTAPLHVRPHEPLTVTFFRRVTSSSVWYEWIVEAPTVGRLHNAGGTAFKLRG